MSPGRIRVSDASNNDANATITDLGIGIRPEDRATALYTLPNYTVNRQTGTFVGVATSDVGVDTPSRGTTHSAFSGIGGILIALLGGALLVSAIRAGHNSNSLGGAAVTSPQAIAGRAQDLGGSLSAGLPVGVTITNYIPVAVRITADTGNINPTNFLEFHVYRSDSPALLNSYLNFTGVSTTGTASSGGNTNGSSNNGGGNNGNNNGGNNNGGSSAIGFAGYGRIPILAQAGHSNLIAFDDPSNKLSSQRLQTRYRR